MNFEDYIELVCRDHSPYGMVLDALAAKHPDGKLTLGDMLQAMMDPNPFQTSELEKQLTRQDWSMIKSRSTSSWQSGPISIPFRKRKKK